MNGGELLILGSGQVAIRSGNDLLNIRRHPEAYPHYWRYTPGERLANLKRLIAYANLTQHNDPNDVFFTADARELDAAIMQSGMPLKDLTFAEIENAILNGVRGKYGDFYKLTARVYISFLKSFIHENANIYRESNKSELISDEVLKETIRRLRASMEEAAKPKIETLGSPSYDDEKQRVIAAIGADAWEAYQKKRQEHEIGKKIIEL